MSTAQRAEMSDLPPLNIETHIGDDLYISFDGQNITLRQPRVYGSFLFRLDPGAYHNMLKWVAQYSVLWERFATNK